MQHIARASRVKHSLGISRAHSTLLQTDELHPQVLGVAAKTRHPRVLTKKGGISGERLPFLWYWIYGAFSSKLAMNAIFRELRKTACGIYRTLICVVDTKYPPHAAYIIVKF